MLAEQLRAAKDPDVPAVAVAIVDADGVRASAAAGVTNLASGTPASPDMVCPWFSMTKIVTATAAMRLHEQGVLDLDLPIASLVPAVARMRPSDDAARITSRHLLSHSSGIANPIPVSWIHRKEEPAPDLGAFVDEQLRKHPKLRSRPGAAASYSNVGFLALGLAMERAASTPFTDLTEREVLRPLGMARTGFSLPSDGRGATGYHPRWSPLRYLLPRWVVGDRVGRWRSLRPFVVDGAPYGGLVGSVEDAAPFVRMHLRDGELDGVRILGSDVAREMREIRTRGKRYDLGLGWFRPASERNADPPFVEHLGGGAGFYNVMRIYPTRGVGVVVMGNVTRYDIDAMAALALEDVV